MPNIPYAIPVETDNDIIRKFEVLLNVIKIKVFSNSDSINNIHTSITRAASDIQSSSASLERAAAKVENAANSISIFKDWNLKVERAKMELNNPKVYKLIVENERAAYEEACKQTNLTIQTTFIAVTAVIVSYYCCKIYKIYNKEDR